MYGESIKTRLLSRQYHSLIEQNIKVGDKFENQLIYNIEYDEIADGAKYIKFKTIEDITQLIEE